VIIEWKILLEMGKNSDLFRVLDCGFGSIFTWRLLKMMVFNIASFSMEEDCVYRYQ
jgi:hypothetical protein